MVQHNIPLSFADHLSPLLKDIFPDSVTAKAYASASTKTTCIVNGSLAPHFKSALVESMKSNPFSIAIDGSNDSGVQKMNPITVKMFDASQGMIVTRFLDMCTTTGIHQAFYIAKILYCKNDMNVGKAAGTAETIFNKMDEVLQANEIPWSNCVGTCVDNTSVNMGIRNSIRSRALAKNSAIYFMGCPCHIVHNTCMKASEEFAKVDIIIGIGI